ncbi:MAG: hypothetical protein LBM70_02725 [Victivallales bacterium]|jgi:hypothetical protein|nr:hypothetical protein [Victivallales bacterium]
MRIYLILLGFCVPGVIFAWGVGHNNMAEYSLKCLPREIRDFWTPAQQEEIHTHYTHYPDGYNKEEIPLDMLDPEDRQLIKQYRINRQRLHQPIGEAIAFYLLTKAFREGNRERAAMFAGSVMHVTADGSAYNHTSLTHFMTFARYKHLKLPPAYFFDLSVMNRYPEVRTIMDSALKDYKPKAVANNLNDALLYIMLNDFRSDYFSNANEDRLARVKESGPALHEALKAMAETGIYQVKEADNLILTAWQLAHGNQPIVFPAGIYDQYAKARMELLAKRTPQDAAVFAGLFDCNLPGPKIGLLAETTRPTGESKFGGGSKFLMGSLGRTLIAHNIAEEVVPLNKVSALNPQITPILALSAGHFGISPELENALREYVARGGKLLFIGGHRDRGLNGELSKHMKIRNNDEVPVSAKYGLQNEKIIQNMAVSFVGPLAKLLGSSPYKFKDNPNTPAGWQKPCSMISIELDDPHIEPWVMLDNDKEKFCVGAAWVDNGKYNAIYLPEYVISPFLLSDDTSMPDWGRPTLDSFATKIALCAVKALLQ